MREEELAALVQFLEQHPVEIVSVAMRKANQVKR
jgi:hypothetical protein